MRGTSHNYNVEDEAVYTDIINFTDNTVDRVNIPVLPAKEVFLDSSINKYKDVSLNIEGISSMVNTLLDKLSNKNISSTNVYSILDSMDIEQNIKSNIETYLYNAGILRQSI